MDDAQRAMWAALRARHPGLRAALAADARVCCAYRGEPSELAGGWAVARAVLRLAWVSDAFAAQALYRIKAAGQRRGVPVLPRLAHRLAMMLGQVCIGDPVIVAAGVYLIHGQVVADGLTEIGAGTAIAPWVTLGLRAGDVRGPRIGAGVSIGTGAKVIGPVTVGDGAVIGANAVVVHDVAAGATVAGVPARPHGVLADPDR